MVKKSKLLPDKPSKLMKVALKDLEKAERSKKYQVDMTIWHSGADAGDAIYPAETCNVCLAGSVMAFSLKVPRESRREPEDLQDSDTKNKLYALDYFREGHVEDGLIQMGLKNKFRVTVCDRDVTDYDTDNRKWKKAMKELIEDFETVGL